MAAPAAWNTPSFTRDYSTREHFSDLKELVVETYKNSEYIKPVAVVETVSKAFLYDAGLTLLRAGERIYSLWDNVSNVWWNRDYYSQKFLGLFKKKKREN
jgi:hypothetical protein